MATYYIELQGGRCGLMEAADLRAAKRIALREEGTNNLKSVRPATLTEIEWVKGMGGFVPAPALEKLKRAGKEV